MEKLWVARDKDGNQLFAYKSKPVRNNRLKVFEANEISPFDEPILLYDELFPEVTWENSPQQVELRLINNNNE